MPRGGAQPELLRSHPADGALSCPAPIVDSRPSLTGGRARRCRDRNRPLAALASPATEAMAAVSVSALALLLAVLHCRAQRSLGAAQEFTVVRDAHLGTSSHISHSTRNARSNAGRSVTLSMRSIKNELFNRQLKESSTVITTSGRNPITESLIAGNVSSTDVVEINQVELGISQTSEMGTTPSYTDIKQDETETIYLENSTTISEKEDVATYELEVITSNIGNGSTELEISLNIDHLPESFRYTTSISRPIGRHDQINTKREYVKILNLDRHVPPNTTTLLSPMDKSNRRLHSPSTNGIDITSENSFNTVFSTQSPNDNTTQDNRDVLLANFKENYPIELWKIYGLFTESFLDLVDDVWMRHPPPAPSAYYVLAGLYFVIMTIGLLGNGLVIYLFVRCRALRTPANILLLNLAISDFFLILNMVLFIYNSILRGPALGYIGCQLYGFIGGLTGTVSIVTLALVAYDRFTVIVFPLTPSRRTSHAGALTMVLFAWGYGAIFSLLPLCGVGVAPYAPEGYLTSCSFDYLRRDRVNHIYIFAFFVAAWVLPLSLIMYCYSRIYHTVLRSSKKAMSVDSQRHCREEEKRRSEMKLATVVAGVVVLWFVSWTPYAVVSLLGVTGQLHLLTPLSSMVPALFCKTASCIDPFLYTVTHPRFRKELRKLWLGRKRRDAKKRGARPWTLGGETRADDRDEASESTERDGEEVFVELHPAGCASSGSDSTSSVSSTPAAGRRKHTRRRSQRVSWTVDETPPFARSVVSQLQPPSWFVPPRPHSERSLSLRLKESVRRDSTPVEVKFSEENKYF